MPTYLPFAWLGRGCNWQRGSRSLTDLTARLKVRADDGHATPLSLSGKPVRLTFILLSALVRCPVSNPIEPQPTPLVCSPANSLKFQSCDRTPQVARLTLAHHFRANSKKVLRSGTACPRKICHTKRASFTARTTGVSNPNRSPSFRPSPSDLF